MARPLAPDDLLDVGAFAAARARPKPKGNGPPVPDRAALTGILSALGPGVRLKRLSAVVSNQRTVWKRPLERAKGFEPSTPTLAT